MREAEEQIAFEGAVCPMPMQPVDRIVLGHGSGGRLMHGLIENLFWPAFENDALRANNDASLIHSAAGEALAVSTDSHVVSPLFFPGGDIGRLAVCGTVNDVAMLGAAPRFLTASFILEEGLQIDVLRCIVESMKAVSVEAEIDIIAGDTKVVEKGKADGLFITTSGIGELKPGLNISGSNARPGDKVILSGPIGDHGIAVLSARGELGFRAEVMSDVAPLNHLISAMLAASPGIHALRDPTRGGLATTLNEIARASGIGIVLEEGAVPVRPAVQSACEMLGFDPMYVANEGKLVAIVDSGATEQVLEALHSNRYGEEAVVVGTVVEHPPGRVLMRTLLGSHRVVDELSGEMLPRIC